MAKPRIFVSSTFYDLNEIRNQLKDFIDSFGYESVLSEFGDIFYSYKQHVQKACLDEIALCHSFILVIGNNYGSTYYIKDQLQLIPDSITLNEFRTALEQKIYKHIFINKFVDYDYKNYKAAIEKMTLAFFQKNDVTNDKVDEVKRRLRLEFDGKYHFPQESYKGIFYFLDIISDLRHNNAITTFETCSDIKENLRKQWAHFMHDWLTNQGILSPVEQQQGNAENNVFRLLNIPVPQKNSVEQKEGFDFFDARTLVSLDKLQDKVAACFDDIFGHKITDSCNMVWIGTKVKLSDKIDLLQARAWLTHVEMLLRSYKWSKRIKADVVFKGLPVMEDSSLDTEILYKSLFELYCEYNYLTDGDKDSFLHMIIENLNCFSGKRLNEEKSDRGIDAMTKREVG